MTSQTSSVVVVAKCPIPGQSKTRLIPLFGEDRSAELAKAMLMDVIDGIEEASKDLEVDRILFYAPPNQTGFQMMKNILLELDEQRISASEADETEQISRHWTLIPIKTSSSAMRSSMLTGILEEAVRTARERQSTTCNAGGQGRVVLMGMDSPEVPIDQVQLACGYEVTDGTSHHRLMINEAFLCPASDGGYGLLSIPSTIPNEMIIDLFRGVRWSHPLTALSQIKAFTDINDRAMEKSHNAIVTVKMGRLMYDIDEPDDIHLLCDRLSRSEQESEGYDINLKDVLLRPLDGIQSKAGPCRFTRSSLKQLEFLV